jgi:succinate dehydrogenase/fumarate reductase iron-sulfur protein
MNTINVKVCRFNPETDTSPFLQEYNNVEYAQDDGSVLDLLLALKDNYDPSLTFRYSCKCTICGSCAMLINGVAKHACVTKVSSLKEDGIITIEPLKNFPVIKDLVVDLEPIIAGLRAVTPWLVKDQANLPEKEYIIEPDKISDTLQLLDKCTICGICHSDSTALAEDLSLITPVAMVKTHKFLLDPRDTLRDARVKQLAELGLLKHSDEWNTTCPKGIDLSSDVVLPLKKLTTQEAQLR